MSDRHTISPYPLRMPEELRVALESEAKEMGRSLHAEIVARLERTLREDRQSLSGDLLEAIRLQASLTLALVSGVGAGRPLVDQQRELDALARVSRLVVERLRS